MVIKMIKNTNQNTTNKPKRQDQNYMYYSKVLNKPFDSIEELGAAEAVYYEELKAKENKAAQKKADAQKVEAALTALNAARKEYKEKLKQLTKEYSEELEDLRKAFELGKKDIHDALAASEEAFDKELKEFTAKYDTYHFSIKGDGFETTISGSTNTSGPKVVPKTSNIFDVFDWMFRF